MREAQRQQTHTRVLAAAEALFLRDGYAETTIRGIAAAAEVSAGTVISVGEKPALLVASFDRHIADIHRRRPAPAPGASRELAEEITGLLSPFVSLFTGQPGLSRIYAAILVSGEHRSTVFTDLADALIGEIVETLELAGLPDPAPVARTLYFAYLGRLFTWPAGSDGDPDALVRSLRELIHSVCQRTEQRP